MCAGGKNYDAEMARQPAPVRAIKTEMASPEFIVRVELMEIHEFSERYPNITSKTSKSTKENEEPKDGKGGKDTQDGKGKDHQSSRLPAPLPSKPNVSGLIIARAMPLSFHLPTHVKTTKGEGARRHGRFP